MVPASLHQAQLGSLHRQLSAAEGSEVRNVGVEPFPILVRCGVEASGSGNEIFEVDDSCSYFGPHRLGQATFVEEDVYPLDDGAIAPFDNSIRLRGVGCDHFMDDTMASTVSLPQLIDEFRPFVSPDTMQLLSSLALSHDMKCFESFKCHLCMFVSQEVALCMGTGTVNCLHQIGLSTI